MNNSTYLLFTSGICGLIAFIITFAIMPRLIKKLKNADIVGRDIHKISKPEVAEIVEASSLSCELIPK